MASEAEVQTLSEIFPHIEKSILTEVLAICEGDLERAIDVIAHSVAEEDEDYEDDDYDDYYDEFEGENEGKSEIILIGIKTDNNCGYCGKKESKKTFYSTTSAITPQDLQTFCDMNWRRSGTCLYKNINQKACCSYYTIRLPVTKFVPNKEQRTVLRNMTCYLETGSIKPKETTKAKTVPVPELSPEEKDIIDQAKTLIKNAVNNLYGGILHSIGSDTSSIPVNFTYNHQNAWSTRGKASCNVAIAIAGLVKKFTKGEMRVSSKEIVDKIAEYIRTNKSPIIEMPFDVNDAGFMNFFVTKIPCDNKKCQPHEKKLKLEASLDKEHTPAHKMEYSIKKSSFDEEEYNLYKKYQVDVHKDKPSEISVESYTDFLVESPVMYVPIGAELPLGVNEYGSYHLQYRIDGKLVGVSVLDILPKSLSSVYFFYDTEYDFLQLGKYSALWEIQYISDIISKHICGIEYYYLGYYIPTITKMKYKSQYKPSELLCEKTRDWVPIDTCLPLFKKAIDAGSTGLVDIDPSSEPRNIPSEEEISAFMHEFNPGIISEKIVFDEQKIREVIHDFLYYTSPDFAKTLLISVYYK